MTEPTPEPTDWWVMIRIPGELHVYQLGTVSDEDLAAAIKVRTDQHGVPEDWWAYPGSGYDVTLSSGEPHQKLLAQATTVTRLPEDGEAAP